MKPRKRLTETEWVGLILVILVLATNIFLVWKIQP